MIDLKEIITNKDNDLDSLSRSNPVILVFLRHFGCIFCKEALHDLAEKKAELAYKKIKLVFVHMTNLAMADKFFREFQFENPEHISDPECSIYQQFGLAKGKLNQLFGLNTWVRGFQISRNLSHHMSVKQIGDSFQMPGIFVLFEGKIVDSYIHKSASDRPDYNKFINCCNT